MKTRLFLCFLSLWTVCTGFSHAADKPNIVLILADDLGWAELGAYGQKKIKTPNLDRLAAQGQRWTEFYSGCPVCSPSRNVLLTGLNTGQTDLQNLKRIDPKEEWPDFKGDWPLSRQAKTLPEALKRAGYDVGAFGKWGLGEYGTTGAPDKHGVDRFFGYTDHKMCHSYYPPFLWDNGKKVVINSPGVYGHAKKPTGEVRAEDYEGQVHSSDLIADKMLEFVQEKAKQKKPFFLYYAPLEPHVSLQPLKKWVDMYPKGWDKKPYRGEKWYLPHPRPKAAYAGMISQMDANVGRLLKTLSDCGLDDNTIVIFTSDNGTTHDVGGIDHKFFDSVAGLKGLKGQVDEGGIRVPFIIRWSGKIKPGTVDQAAYAADVMPTLCQIAGAEKGITSGTDLSPVLAGKTAKLAERTPMLWFFCGYGGQVAARIGDLKVVRKNLLPAGKKMKVGDWEVYDIKKDPQEKENLAASHEPLIRQAIDILNKEYRKAEGYPRLDFAREPAAPALTK